MLGHEGTAALPALLGGALQLHHLAAPSLAGVPTTPLGARWGLEPARVGHVEEGRRARWEQDLQDARECLQEAGHRVGAALDAGRAPVLCSGHCPPCMATLPAVARRLPACRVLWIDAHPDFDSPRTTPSGFLGGMCLAAACGVWESGLDGALPASQVVVSDGRDVDPGERELLRDHLVRVVPPGVAADAVAGEDVFLHLDLDVLDPRFLPGLDFPVPHGLDPAGLEALLAAVVAKARLVGIEITDCPASELAPSLAGVLARGLGGAPAERAG